jgi:hypothetical protein
MTAVGTLESGALASVAADGTITTRAGSMLRWQLRPADVWLVPGADAPVRRGRPDPAPVVRTTARVPGGDVYQWVYAVSDDGGAIVVDVDNDSSRPIAVWLGFQAASGEALALSRAPGATEPDGAVVFAVPHRTGVRVAIGRPGLVVRALPARETVVRGWDRALDRGMRTELPEQLQHEVDVARADLLLERPSAATFAALEAWGFDEEAIAMWERLGLRARRVARHGRPVGILGETRAALLTERDSTIECFPGFDTAWLGSNLAVHDAPVRTGRASFALRWHGARPALLWDVPAGTRLFAPVLDPRFETTRPIGETLLREPPTGLLAMGERAPVAGGSVAPPEEFT